MSRAQIAARKYMGHAPFDGPDNTVRGDTVFKNHARRMFGEKVWREALAEIGVTENE